jgi:tRNA threonylcarbamoyladenosine biosynthesis protein TsaE
VTATPSPATRSELPATRVQVRTAADMQALGRRLAGLLRAGDLVVLSGPLGAGKTTLVQGIGAGLQVRGPVTSPTFVIARVHPSLAGGPGLVHVDAYRLASVAEVDDLDLDASVDDCVTVVEWGEGLVEGLAADRLEVSIALDPAGPATEPGLMEQAGTAADAGPMDPAGPATEPGPMEQAGTAAGAGPMNPAGTAAETRVVTLTGVGERWADGTESVGCGVPVTPEAI